MQGKNKYVHDVFGLLKAEWFSIEKGKVSSRITKLYFRAGVHGSWKVNDSLRFLWKGFCFGCSKVTHYPYMSIRLAAS